MKVLICNAGSYENKGDGAILLSMLDALSARFFEIEIDIAGNITSYQSAEREDSLSSGRVNFVELPSFVVLNVIKHHLMMNSKTQPNPRSKSRPSNEKGDIGCKVKPRYLIAFRTYLLLIDAIITSLVPKKLFKKYFVSPFRKSDLDIFSYDAIIMAGGTQLEDKEYAGYPGFAHNLSILGAAVAAHIPFFITGQSIGPIRSKFGRFVTRHILNRAGGICLREGLSQRYVLENLKVKRQTRLGSDWAFLLPTISDKDAKQLIQKYFAYPDRQKIAIIPRKIVSSTGNPYLNLKELAKVADRLIQMENTEVILFPQTIASATLLHDDLQTCFQIQKIMTNKIEVIDTRNWTVGEIAGFLGAVDLLVTFRMHAIIMAAAAGGTPAIAISHIHKFEGVMELLGIKELVVSHDKCTSEIILEKVRYAFDNQGKILSELECGIVKAKRLAVENSEMVRGYFYEGSKQG
jgi:colanic acid/amylovoran biosynthesis protein